MTLESVMRYGELTPEGANHYLHDYIYARQRNIRPARTQFLAYQHMHDRLLGKIMYLVTAELPDKTKYMINGYHTCRAVIQACKPLMINFHRLQAEDMAEVNELYSKYDRALPRNTADALKAHDVKLEVTQADIAVFGGAVRHILNSFRSFGGQKSKQVLVAKTDELYISAAEDWAPWAMLYFNLLANESKEGRRIFRNSPTLAVAMICFRHATARADGFWTATVSPRNMEELYPPVQLHNVLRDMLLRGGKRASLNPALYLAVASKAWNIYYDGRQFNKRMRVPYKSKDDIHKARAPLLLKGTPYDGQNYVVPDVPGFDMKAEIDSLRQLCEDDDNDE